MPVATIPYTPLTTVYCTDEEIAVRAPGDFVDLCPPEQTLAIGADGVFLAADVWTMISASVSLSGLAFGNVVVLSLNPPKYNILPNNAKFVVDVIAPGGNNNAVTLRRLGQASHVGAPPAPPAGLTNVIFNVPTLGPQIEDVSYRINQQYNIDAQILSRQLSMLYDSREIQQLAVVEVLTRQYRAMTRKPDDQFARQGVNYAAMLDTLRESTQVKWFSAVNAAVTTDWTSCRVLR